MSTVKERRQELNMTQAALAEASGTSQPTISAIEAGHVPRLSVAYAVARALDCTPEDLFQVVAS